MPQSLRSSDLIFSLSFHIPSPLSPWLRQMLTCTQGNLEFELRLQQYVEMVRTGNTQKLQEATQHARKYLASHSDTKYAIRAAGLLAFPPDTPAEPYKVSLQPLAIRVQSPQ